MDKYNGFNIIKSNRNFIKKEVKINNTSSKYMFRIAFDHYMTDIIT